MAPKKKSATKKKNSLVNNINARKKKGKSRSKKRSTISKESYTDMENNWGKKKSDCYLKIKNYDYDIK